MKFFFGRRTHKTVTAFSFAAAVFRAPAQEPAKDVPIRTEIKTYDTMRASSPNFWGFVPRPIGDCADFVNDLVDESVMPLREGAFFLAVCTQIAPANPIPIISNTVCARRGRNVCIEVDDVIGDVEHYWRMLDRQLSETRPLYKNEYGNALHSPKP